MKKVWGWVIGVALVVVIGFYIIWNSSNAAPMTITGAGTTGTDNNSGAGAGQATTTNTGTSGGATGGGTTGGTTSGYKNGTYTGTVADAVYGQLQVAVTISGGKITDIAYPVYPNSPGHTSEVAAFALPALKQEAIASQSANVNIVSGATQDSEAFQQSLASALAQAQG
jgi:uncharacterized protein with FMN-binding domain